MDLGTRITRNIRIKTPLVASPMEDISEHQLAIAVALQGFPAVIHSNLAIEEQAAQVRRVKRFENGFVQDPITLSPEDPIARAVQIREETGISTLPIVEGRRLVGLLTKNDYSGAKHAQRRVKERMVPLERLRHQIAHLRELPADDAARLAKANDLLLESHAGVLLIVTDAGELDSLVTRTDIEKSEAFPDSIKDRNDSLVVGAAVPTRPGEVRERVRELVSAGVDFLCVDSSHGNSLHERQVIEHIKGEYPQDRRHLRERGRGRAARWPASSGGPTPSGWARGWAPSARPPRSAWEPAPRSRPPIPAPWPCGSTAASTASSRPSR